MPNPDLSKLSPRQLDVLVALAEGATPNEIAAQLNMRRRNVGLRLREIRQRLGFETLHEVRRFTWRWDPDEIRQIARTLRPPRPPFILIRRLRPPLDLEKLTPRQQDILEYLATGATRRQIAERAHITLGTVQTTLRWMKHRLGFADLSGLRDFAARWVAMKETEE